ALEGCDVAYYLVHSLASGPGWPEREVRTAEVFRGAAAAQRWVDGDPGPDHRLLAPPGCARSGRNADDLRSGAPAAQPPSHGASRASPRVRPRSGSESVGRDGPTGGRSESSAGASGASQ